MEKEFNEDLARQACAEFEAQVMLYASEELEGAERDRLEDHLDQCSRCAAALEAERRMLDMLSDHRPAEPAPALLTSCRDRLEDSLDEMDHRSLFVRWAEAIFPAHWLALHPAPTAAMLILIGFSAGAFLPWHGQVQSPAPTQNASLLGTTPLDEQALRSADVSGINWTPGEDNRPARVEVQITTEQPRVVQGTVDDSQVKRILLYVLRNSRQFGPDVRINSVELLKGHANDAQVQQALCDAAQHDRNPAVRLMSLEALSNSAPDPEVLRTMLDTLTKDSNPGVRIAAINSLRAYTEHGELQLHADPRAMDILKELMKNDPNNYIRLQSAAAVQQSTMGPQQ